MAEITIRDIAKECGVGVSTVSRAMNNHPDINPETKARIAEVIEKYGYIPNNSARNLKRTEANSIAVLIKGITNPFFTVMIKIIEEETQARKHAMVLHHVESQENEVDVALELVKEKRLRGIIFLGGYFSHTEEKLDKLKVPFVFSTVGAAPGLNIQKNTYSNIAVDDEKESEKMVSYLQELGHREIAILTTPYMDGSIGQLRLQGYRTAMDRFGGGKDSLVRYVREDMDNYSMENGYLTAKELIASGQHFTAVYAIADMLAIGACRALREAGLRIPEDVSVAGFDGLELGEYYNPGITTVKQPVEEMALATVKLLFHIMEGREEHKHIVFPASLVVRESTDKVPAKK